MDTFKDLINELNPFLKQVGFTKRGSNFYLELGENYGIINFQKSKESTKETVKFTINFGVYSNALGKFQYENIVSVKPEFEQCQWRARLGNFMPGNPDFWWFVNTSENLTNVVSNIMEIIKSIVMPELNKRLSDEGLVNSWMNETYAGTTDIGRFKYLTILLNKFNEYDSLSRVVYAFMHKAKGRPNAVIAMEHLRDIGLYIKK